VWRKRNATNVTMADGHQVKCHLLRPFAEMEPVIEVNAEE
jgi:prepilin-type processing-associated H-X9-DG protein